MSCPCQVYSKVSELYTYPLALDYFLLDLKAPCCAVVRPIAWVIQTLCLTILLGRWGEKTTAEDSGPASVVSKTVKLPNCLEPSLAVFAQLGCAQQPEALEHP